MPAAPLLSAPAEFAAVELPLTDGSMFTKSAMFAGACALISSWPIVVTGVGASFAVRATREPVT
jgi:hypothetical protein